MEREGFFDARMCQKAMDAGSFLRLMTPTYNLFTSIYLYIIRSSTFEHLHLYHVPILAQRSAHSRTFMRTSWHEEHEELCAILCDTPCKRIAPRQRKAMCGLPTSFLSCLVGQEMSILAMCADKTASTATECIIAPNASNKDRANGSGRSWQ